MPTMTIHLDEQSFEALQSIARENGLPGAEGLVTAQIDRLLASYRGPGLTPGLREHLQASIEENRPCWSAWPNDGFPDA